MASSINWLICGLTAAGSIIFATPSTLPFTGMAPPTRFVHLATLVESYTIFGYASVIMEIMDRANSLFTKIWLGISPVIMACP